MYSKTTFSAFYHFIFITSILAEVPELSRVMDQCDEVEFSDAVEGLMSTLTDHIKESINPALTDLYGPPCSCGSGGWTKVADLNLSDTNQACPGSWQRLVFDSESGCGKVRSGCSSASFPTSQSYSQVCGRIIAISFGSLEAFDNYFRNNLGLDGGYIDGVSLTHGSSGSRTHIWSFAAALSENEIIARVTCPCAYPSNTWPLSILPYVGENYFCDTGSEGPGATPRYYNEDPVWDGDGCGASSSCCSFNNPPWFCTNLPSPTTDPLEARICTNAGIANENIAVTRVDLYVR